MSGWLLLAAPLPDTGAASGCILLLRIDDRRKMFGNI
jgi:uncharacterized membrane protein